MCALCSPACQVLARLDSLNASVWVLNSLSVLCTHMYKWNACQNEANEIYHSLLTILGTAGWQFYQDVISELLTF